MHCRETYGKRIGPVDRADCRKGADQASKKSFACRLANATLSSVIELAG
jgi:hypothetical protein